MRCASAACKRCFPQQKAWSQDSARRPWAGAKLQSSVFRGPEGRAQHQEIRRSEIRAQSSVHLHHRKLIKAHTMSPKTTKGNKLWMDKILHHHRNPGMMIPQCQQSHGVLLGSKRRVSSIRRKPTSTTPRVLGELWIHPAGRRSPGLGRSPSAG